MNQVALPVLRDFIQRLLGLDVVEKFGEDAVTVLVPFEEGTDEEYRPRNYTSKDFDTVHMIMRELDKTWQGKKFSTLMDEVEESGYRKAFKKCSIEMGLKYKHKYLSPLFIDTPEVLRDGNGFYPGFPRAVYEQARNEKKYWKREFNEKFLVAARNGEIQAVGLGADPLSLERVLVDYSTAMTLLAEHGILPTADQSDGHFAKWAPQEVYEIASQEINSSREALRALKVASKKSRIRRVWINDVNALFNEKNLSDASDLAAADGSSIDGFSSLPSAKNPLVKFPKKPKRNTDSLQRRLYEIYLEYAEKGLEPPSNSEVLQLFVVNGKAVVLDSSGREKNLTTAMIRSKKRSLFESQIKCDSSKI